MAEVLLTQAVNEAEEAIESGNYGGAIEACQRILGQFPEFAGAHRIMAEAYAEKGDYEAAREAYQRTIERDPQSIAAHLGLGMLADEAGDRDSALAYVQVAWEIDPRRRDLREHVSRISQQLYGADGRLYLTRAALASLHFHAGRWDRAVSEAAQVLQDYPSRIDVQVRLAESLWRRGDDEQARQASDSILRALPSAVVPLLILADIHRRQGDQQVAENYLSQARSIDPDGVRAADLIVVGFDDQADFLSIDDIPTIDDQIVHEEPARYAPAPDFTASDSEDIPAAVPAEDDVVVPTQPEMGAEQTPPDWSNLDTDDVQPFRWEDIGDEDLEASDLDVPADDLAAEGGPPAEDPTDFSLPTDEEIQQARPGAEQERGHTEMLDSLQSQGMEPFDPTGGEQSAVPEAPADDFSLDDLTMPSDEEIEQARPTDAHPEGYTGMLSSLEEQGVQPFDPSGSGESVTPEREDWLGELEVPGEEEPAEPEPTVAEEAGEDDWLSEFSLPSDDELHEARPEEAHPAGYTGMLSSLDAEGMEPFDPGLPDESPVGEPGQPEPATADDAEGDGALELGELGQESPFELDWSDIDQEIEQARPDEMPRGYTDQLRALDDDGLEPFEFGGEQGTGIEDAPEAAGMVEGLPESEPDPFDMSDLDDTWSSEPEAAAMDLPDLPVDDAGGLDSIGVMFPEESKQEYAETERLQQDPFAQAEGEPVAAEEEMAAAGDWDLSEDLFSADDTGASEQELQQVISDPDEAAIADLFEETPAVAEDAVARETQQATPGRSRISAERLGLDEDLIERARAAKQQLIDEGRIGGHTPLPGTESDVEVDKLRSDVERDPENVDRRIALAHELLESNPDEALEQYRWLYRNAPERGADVVRDLAHLIEIMREREVGVHRLLGALYRRHGDWAAAATHYEESLSYRRVRSRSK